MAVFMTAIIETEGWGLYMQEQPRDGDGFSGVGNLIAPPLGNSLAGISPGFPFVF